jgi:adenosylcobinamide kinase/adenosylcobinamide-phosphate guanylyltransferase
VPALVTREVHGDLPRVLAEWARRCVDALGVLHQQVAAQCSRVTWMLAGIELTVKDER